MEQPEEEKSLEKWAPELTSPALREALDTRRRCCLTEIYSSLEGGTLPAIHRADYTEMFSKLSEKPGERFPCQIEKIG